ncbi:MAG TPA: ADP/ATP-dependent (S)-NAD(P)H-hydrate dehydratase [Aquihabitans sp.]|nr:ADP/ATP-dependent (S)-NAD(P)H-hydrate dehydratase [Aquihabitans sp.]
MTEPRTLTPAVLAEHPLPSAEGATSKHDRGTVLAVGGDVETPGALLLAGTAALRAGAGRLQLAVAAPVAPILAVAVPEARVLGLALGDGGGLATPGDALLEAMAEAEAVLVGSGVCETDDAEVLLAAAIEALAETDGRLVVDARALDRLGEAPDRLGPLAARTVAIPNPGEAASVLGGSPDDVESDPEAALEALVGRLGCTVALRGSTTLIGGPEVAVHVERSGPIGLATSGSGDVLAGLLAGYLARGASPLDATLWAVHVHATAGRRCGAAHGPLGYLAREVVDALLGAHGEVS